MGAGRHTGSGQDPPDATAAAEDLTGVVRRAADLAEELLQQAASERRSWRQRRRESLLSALVADEAARRFAFRLTDRVARCPDPEVAARLLRLLIAKDGIPPSLPVIERVGLRLAATSAPRAPRLVMPLVQARLRNTGRAVVIDADPSRLQRHLQRRRANGIVSNINVLGEAILGDDEAADRLERILAQLRSPEVGYVSVKLSSIAANLSVLAFEDTVERLAPRLASVYLVALESDPAKFVNLDMEEYRDLHLTMATFRRVLGAGGDGRLSSFEAGIVLQAYLPDSLPALVELTAWARQRVAAGGAGIKVRLVKGANLAMECVDAELHGWPQAPYPTKADVDANYKRLVEWALRPEHAAAVRIGVASHNLFDVCFALALAEQRGVSDRLDIEMLEGMADAQAAVVCRRAGRLVLYTPVAARRDFSSAIAYLTRRLDENTAPQNYLAHALRLADDPALRQSERSRFEASVRDRDNPSTGPRRKQRRPEPVGSVRTAGPFVNAADTDFTLAANRSWLHHELARHRPRTLAPEPDSIAAVDAVVARARRASDLWAGSSADDRRSLLLRVADELEAGRGEAVAAMVAEAAKVVSEADTEVSEAVDFARYYADGAMSLFAIPGLRHRPRGVVAVLSPWNFPYAIPASGILAALAAGNGVVLKPAPQTTGVGQLLAEQLWRAGVPPDLLQVLNAPEDERGRRLITHPDIAAVILTGSTATAELFTDWRPDLRLHAETSGKNAIVVTASADVDQAVRDLVRSAFGHAGQKCSAASLAIVERQVHDRPTFLRQLRDAVTSLAVGDPTDLAAVVGPLIDPPGEALRRALTTLDPGESWLVEPRPLDAAQRLWQPGVKTGIRPGSWFHHTECFGPVLGVMRADSLDEATAWQNQVAYGLTAGLHSLDETEISWWLDHVEAGNAYVNRAITGAVVQRQPFGGWKRSTVGPGAKAGGPNYVASLGSWQEAAPPDAIDLSPQRADLRDAVAALAATATRAELMATAVSYEAAWQVHFGCEHDPSGLASESNRFRYRRLRGPCLLRVEADASPLAVARAMLAAVTTGTSLVVSLAEPPLPWLRAGRFGVLDVVIEDQQRLAGRLAADEAGQVARVRLLGAAGEALWRASRRAWLALVDDAVVGHGRVELTRWLLEQTVSETRHRYGNPC